MSFTVSFLGQATGMWCHWVLMYVLSVVSLKPYAGSNAKSLQMRHSDWHTDAESCVHIHTERILYPELLMSTTLYCSSLKHRPGHIQAFQRSDIIHSGLIICYKQFQKQIQVGSALFFFST